MRLVFINIIVVFFFLTFLSCNKNNNVTSVNLLGAPVVYNDYFLPKSTTGVVIRHRFYTLSYAEEHEQAEWVAYELKKKDIVRVNFKRPYFIEDPKVPTKSASWRNYIRSGYDRGHLCPAADRRFSREAFNETFYTSNVSPQRNDFNAGIWNRLEQKTRYWALKYDGVYVVTGGVLDNHQKTIGKEKITVPNYFYKVLMDRSGGTYKMIAFLIPHKESDKPLYHYVVSVDKIEKMTGIDFFPNLQDDLENDLERKADYKQWAF